MYASENAVNLIKKWDSLRLTASETQNPNVFLIGYGHRKKKNDGDSISLEIAEKYLKKDIKNAERIVNNCPLKFKLNQNQFDALVSFTHSMGEKALYKIIDAPDAYSLADKMNKCTMSKTYSHLKLIKRRKEETALFLNDLENTYNEQQKSPLELSSFIQSDACFASISCSNTRAQDSYLSIISISNFFEESLPFSDYNKAKEQSAKEEITFEEFIYETAHSSTKKQLPIKKRNIHNHHSNVKE